MRILLVTPLIQARNFQPLAFEYLSACLKKNGHEVRLADASFRRRAAQEVARFQPEMVGYHVISGTHAAMLRLNRELKRRFSFTAVFGGPHATFYPEMIHEEGVDGICLGEGEEAIVEFCTSLARGERGAKVRNFHVNVGGEVKKNPLRPLIQDLDALPLPDWSLSDSFDYCRNFPVKLFIASRGCPYNCAFCTMANFHRLYPGQKVYRLRKAESFVAEIVACRQRRDFAFAYLYDDTFGIDKQWLAAFGGLYREQVKKPFCVQLRADVVDEQSIKMLVAAGLAHATMGVETGSETMRAKLLNKHLGDGQLIQAASLLRRYHVPLMTYNMIGLPGTTLDDDLETLRFNRRLKPAYAESYIYQPYPGTELGRRAVEDGLFSGDVDRIGRSLKRRIPLTGDKKKQRERLVHIFPLLTAQRTPDRLTRLLLALPLNTLYRLMDKIYDGYIRGVKIYRLSIPWRIMVRMFWHYLRF